MNIPRLLMFEVHEEPVNMYFDEMASEVLINHAGVGIEQIRIADKEIFKRLGEETRGGFTRIVTTDDNSRLDAILRRITKEHRIQSLLNPHQTVPTRASQSNGPTTGEKRLAEENNRLKNELNSLKSNSGNKVKAALEEKVPKVAVESPMAAAVARQEKQGKAAVRHYRRH